MPFKGGDGTEKNGERPSRPCVHPANFARYKEDPNMLTIFVISAGAAIALTIAAVLMQPSEQKVRY